MKHPRVPSKDLLWSVPLWIFRAKTLPGLNRWNDISRNAETGDAPYISKKTHMAESTSLFVFLKKIRVDDILSGSLHNTISNIFQPDWLEAAFPHSHFKRPVFMTSAALRRKKGTAGRANWTACCCGPLCKYEDGLEPWHQNVHVSYHRYRNDP